MSLFEMNLYGRLVSLCEAINSRSYVPTANYAFIHYRPKAREVFAAEPELKIIMAYLDMRVNALIDAKLSDRTFNNRIDKGTQAAINRVIEDMGECPNGWIIKIDLKGYFPNIDQSKAYALIENLILTECEEAEKDELLYLARVACFCNPQERCEKRSQLIEWAVIPDYKSLFRKPFGIGGAIGFLFWQVMSNYYLADIDKWILKSISPHYVRFVDDMVIVTDNKEPALVMIAELRRRLGDIGVTLHPDKYYCQHVTKGLEFLGYHIGRNGVHINRKIQERALRRASQWHRRHYLEAMNSYLGILKSGSDRNILEAMMKRVPDRYIKDFKNWKINERRPRSLKSQKEYGTKHNYKKVHNS